MRITNNIKEATQFQQAFLTIMAGKDISFDENNDLKLRALCEAMGVKFKKKK